MPAFLVDSREAFERMVGKLAGARIIACDIECASNLHHYLNRVCLIQLSTERENFVVDALADIDLSPVRLILEDPATEIVMHDTDFDLRSMDRDFGWRPKNLFDTQLAARLCGHREFGLAKLLEHHFGIKRSKKFQRADWTMRPLPREMLEYAAADVATLVRLRDVLAARLTELGRMEWAQAEFAQCENIRFTPDDRPLYARVKGAHSLASGRELAILKELADVRDAIAREIDLPHFMVIGDEALVGLAARPPRTAKDISSRRGLHPACKKKFAQKILDAVARGMGADPIFWPRPKRERGCSIQKLDKLKTWRTAFAKENGVEVDLVLSKNSLVRLASDESIDEVLGQEPSMKWRGDEIRRAILKIVSKYGDFRS